MKDEFCGVIFEGVLLGATDSFHGRGSSFGTMFDYDIPVYDPLNPSNVMTIPTLPSTGPENGGKRPSP